MNDKELKIIDKQIEEIDRFLLKSKTDDELIDLVIKLQQENQQLKETLKGTTHCFDEEEHRKLKQKNETLKEKVNFYNGWYKHGDNKYYAYTQNIDYKHILNNLQSWLEEEIKRISKEIEEFEPTYEANGFGGVIDDEDIGYRMEGYKTGLNNSLDKLKELKGSDE